MELDENVRGAKESKQLTLDEVGERLEEELSREIDENRTDVLKRIVELEDRVDRIDALLQELLPHETLDEWTRRSSVLPLRIENKVMTCVALRRGNPEGMFPEALTMAVREEDGSEVVADYMLSRSSIVKRR